MGKLSLLQKYIFSFLFAVAIFFSFPILVSAATFTVDSTGDGADAVTDGLCATSGGVCTLRAAIAEASATGGPHTINFNIPTSDTGYVDFDGGVGDGVGGDDHFLITPITALPTITSGGITIDGATQTTNIGDTNTLGPEIVIDGHTAGEVRGLYFTGTNGVVNSITIYRFGSTAAAIEVTGDGFIITNSYVGPFAKGTTTPTGTDRSAYGVYLNVASGIVGNTISDGNVISGITTFGIYAACGTGGSGKTVNIAGNKIGLGSDGDTYLPNGVGIKLENDCISIVGGNTSANRNYIAGGTIFTVAGGGGLLVIPSNNNIVNIQIYNNFFGTEITGTQKRGGSISLNVNINVEPVSAYNGAQNPIIIGATGKGNLIAHADAPGSLGVLVNRGRSTEIAYNTFYGNITGIQVSNGTSGQNYDVNIHHNYIGAFSPDPYFGLTTTGNMAQAVNIQTNINGAKVHDNYSNDNKKSGTGTGGAIRSSGTSNNTEIYSNVVTNTPGCGIFILSGSNHKVYDNTLNNDLTHVGCGISTQSTTNTEIYNNTVTNTNSVGMGAPLSTNTYFHDNIITNNSLGGLNLSDTTNAKVSNNIIHDNLTTTTDISYISTVPLVGIDSYTVVPNDAGDVDSGTPNNRQNWPEIQEVEYHGTGEYRVSGRLDGKVSEAPFTIEICESNGHASSHGGCIDTLGTTVTASTPDSISGASNYFNWTADVQTQYSTKNPEIIFTTTATSNLNATSQYGLNYNCSNDVDCSTVDYNIALVSPASNATIDDVTPLLDWNAPISDEGVVDPSLDHYSLVIDGVEVVTTDAGTTQYQLTDAQRLSFGSHSWKVIAYRGGDVTSAESIEYSFTITTPKYDFTLVYPVDIEIDTLTPTFDWTDFEEGSDATSYDVFVDSQYFGTSSISKTELLAASELPEGEHTWQVVAYFRDVNSKYVEVGRTTTATFTIKLPIVIDLPVTGEEEVVTTPTPTAAIKENNLVNILGGSRWILLGITGGVVTLGICAGAYLGWIPFLVFLKKKRKEKAK